MTKVGAGVIGVVAVGIAVYAASYRARASSIAAAASNGEDRSASAPREATTLTFRDLVEPTSRALKPTALARDLAGKRVRMTGFMAEMEMAPKGAFYLTPVPVHCDEAGGGTADLPPTSVLIVVPSAKGQKIEHVSGELEAIGIWEIGNRADDDGRLSFFRLVLDDPWPHTRSTEKVR